MKTRSATEIFEFVEQFGLYWQEHPDLSFGKLVSLSMPKNDDLYLAKDKDVLKNISKYLEKRNKTTIKENDE